MKKLFLLATLTFMVSACTHSKIDVTEIDDTTKSCQQLKSELSQLDEMDRDIDEKTGFSGRNIGMALVFWPGILVNEMNANDAEERIRDRKKHLVRIYNDNNCS